MSTPESKPRILIVDDEEHIRTALTRWFKIRGFETDVAEDGQQAVQKCEESAYDVITMDLEMPHMGGAEAIDRIRELNPNVPILVLTGFSSEAERTPLAGAAKVLTKPLRLMELEAEVRQLIGQAAS